MVHIRPPCNRAERRKNLVERCIWQSTFTQKCLLILGLLLATSWYAGRRLSHDKKRLMAVFHIGPHKTATTSIQGFLYKDETRDHLKKDGFSFIPRRDETNPAHYDMLRVYWNQKKPWGYGPEVWDPLAAHLRSLRQQGSHFLASDEGWSRALDSPQNFVPLRKALEGFDVRVSLTYRRYTEWLLSYYHEQTRYKFWTPVDSFTDYFHDLVQYEAQLGDFLPHYMIHWKSLVENDNHFVVYNYHEHTKQAFVADFICDTIPMANRTCKAARHEASKDRTRNVGPKVDTFEAQRLAVAARDEGIIHLMDDEDGENSDNGEEEKEWWEEYKKRLSTLISRLAARMHGLSEEMPLVCPSQDQLDIIRQRTLKLERVLAPDYFNSQEGRTAMEASFTRAETEKWYCNVDVAKLLKSDAWKQDLVSMAEQVRRDAESSTKE